MLRFLHRLPHVAVCLLGLGMFVSQRASASTKAEPSVLMLSDINFDPFHDPAKFDLLRKTSVRKWLSILNQPDSPTQAADFTRLQATCGAHGVDSSVSLFESALDAAHHTQPKPLFVTVSGDLIGTSFDCRYRALTSGKFNQSDYTAFVSKTISFVAYRLWLTFPNSHVYIALGNADSGCKDFGVDPNSTFLREAALTVTGNSPSPATRWAILYNFPHFGDYNVELPKPMQKTRLIVLQDAYESTHHTTCTGMPNPEHIAREHVTWLRSQLAAARNAHQHVWIMAHIPPGVDANSTVASANNVCTGGQPIMFQSSSALLQAITDYGDVVQLTLYGHSHMDEWRVYKNTADTASAQTYIPGKLVPSISPSDGNNPAFTIAQVTPATATIHDYVVYSADRATSTPTNWKQAAWTEEYRYSTTYNMPDMSGASLEKLASRLTTDPAGTSLTSVDYERYFLPGDNGAQSRSMQTAWSAYACSTKEQTAEGFRQCACPSTPAQTVSTNTLDPTN